MARLKQLLVDPKSGLTNRTTFIKRAKELNIDLTKKQIGEYYDKQVVNQVFKQLKTNRKNHRKISCAYGRGCLHADLMDIQKFSRHNNGYRFLLTIVEYPTRYCWSYPLKNKQPRTVAPALKKAYDSFLKVEPNHIINLQTDDGSEFKGAVNSLNKKYQVRHVRTVNKNAMGLVESQHKTFWNFFRRWSAVNQNRLDFVQHLPDFVYNYNTRIHSVTKEKPDDLFHGRKPVPIFHVNWNDNLYSIGDQVRIKRKGNLFDKNSFLPTLSNAVYSLVKQVGPRWVLKNDKGNELKTKYLERELVRINDVDDPIEQESQVPRRLEQAISARDREARTRRLNRQSFTPDKDLIIFDEITGEPVLGPRLRPSSTVRERRAKKRFAIEG